MKKPVILFVELEALSMQMFESTPLEIQAFFSSSPYLIFNKVFLLHIECYIHPWIEKPTFHL